MSAPQQMGRWAVALAVGLAAAPACWSLDLAEAWRLALQRDATIRGSLAATEAAREKLPQARAQFFPNISLNAARARNRLETTAPDALGRPTTSDSEYTSSNNALVIRQPIFRKQLTAQYQHAKATVADAEALLERDQQQLVARVTQSYFEVLLAEEELRVASQQKEALVTQVDAARKGFAAGAGTRTDVDEAQSRLDLAVADELKAKQQVDLARRQLEVIIDQPVNGAVAAIDVRKLKLAPPTPATVLEWTATAEAASPEMRSALAQVDVAKADVERAKAGHYPTLDAVAQISRSRSDNITRIDTEYNQKQLGLQLSVPIFQGGYVNSQVREALALQQKAQERLDEVRRDLGVRVHKEFRGVTEGVLRVKALEQAVRSAEQLVVSSRRSHEAGARTRIDILNAEQQLAAARRDLAQARFAYVIARVRLTALAGGLRDENIDEINGWLQH